MRQIPPALRAHLQQSVTTVCYLLTMTLRDGRVFGMTTLDRDVEYMGVTFSAANGFDKSIMATDVGASVDNAEGYMLFAGPLPGITLEMIGAGELDDAEWEMMLVNWADLSMGHCLIDAGDVGEVTVHDGMAYAPELNSFFVRLRQAFGHYDSIRCRAVFGTPPNSQTGCGVDAEPMWVEGEVTGVGAEPYRVFADASIDLSSISNTARVQWLSGPNAGQRLYQVEGISAASGTIGLVEPAPFQIEAGHTFRIRPDCDKSPAQCTAYGNFLDYKGENLIPVGEGREVLTPNASITGGFMGSEVVD